jgi:integrase/recombinase XerD
MAEEEQVMNWIALVEDYLSRRRQLGYQLTIDGRQLLNFARYAEQRNAELPLTVSLARDWAGAAPSGSAIAMARRASLLRPFSRYLNLIDPGAHTLPSRLMGPTHRRLPPFIFSPKDIAELMSACDSLFSLVGLRPHTMRTLIGLLAATGLRPGEAVRLKQQDVNQAKRLLIIHDSKGWKRRMVPLSDCSVAALDDYQRYRNQLTAYTLTDAFFILDTGKPLDIRSADYAFSLLRTQVNLTHPNTGRAPRLYDLRHTFVCNRLLAWYETNEAVDSLMPQLAQYIGHKKVSDTYWYIQSVPALMSKAADRFENHGLNSGGEV